MSNPVPNLQSSRDDSQSSAGESSTHVTPITTPSTLGHFCPSFTCAGPDKCLHKFDAGFYASEHTFHREQDIDPKTLFVGGLEATGVHAWGIDKLRRVFEKYGVVEDIRLICPCGFSSFSPIAHSLIASNAANKKTLFAFVTFSDENAPLRAIAEEVTMRWYISPLVTSDLPHSHIAQPCLRWPHHPGTTAGSSA
jgi:hypothetical protein